MAIVFFCEAIVFFSCETDSTRDAVRVTFDFFERLLAVVAIEETRLVTVAGETKDVAGSVYAVCNQLAPVTELSFMPGAWWRQGKSFS